MPKKIDLSNTETEYFYILTPAPNKGGRTQWNCICKRCGNPCIIPTGSLRNTSRKTQSCGCLQRDLLAQRNKDNYKDLTGKRFGHLVCLEYKGSMRGHSAWLCKCDCGRTIITDSGSLWVGRNTSCGCAKVSIGEKNIETILLENNIHYKKEYTFSDLVSNNNVPLRFDFAILDDNNQVIRLIEYDGEQHFQRKADLVFSDTLEGRQEKDNLKNQYCLIHNIPLIRINYHEKNHITLDMLMTDKNYLVKEKENEL